MQFTKDEKQKAQWYAHCVERIRKGFFLAESADGCIWPFDAVEAMREFAYTEDLDALLRKVAK